MKNLFKLAFCALFATLSITSCDKDHEDQSLIGNWEYSKTIVTKIDSKSVNYDITDLMDTNGDMVFFENGTCRLINNKIANWKYIKNETAIEIAILKDKEDIEEGKDQFERLILPFKFSGNELIFNDNDFYLGNSDRYPDEGNISFSKFNKLFNENISPNSEEDISVSAKVIFLKK